MITDIILKKKSFRKIYFEHNLKLIEKKVNRPLLDNEIRHIKLKTNRYLNDAIKTSYGFCIEGMDSIFINLKSIYDAIDIRNKSDNKNYDFYQCICETLTHEEIHKTIEVLGEKESIRKYDNIKKRLREYGYMA